MTNQPRGSSPDLPKWVKPQLCKLVDAPPQGPEWLHEIKYDGYRLLARLEDGEVRLITRGGLDWTAKFPTLAHRLGELTLDSALIDGELVHLEPNGTTSFSGLQDAISSGKTGTLNFFAFDLLHRDGWNLTGAALEDRKIALAEIISPQAQGLLRYSDHQIDRGPAFRGAGRITLPRLAGTHEVAHLVVGEPINLRQLLRRLLRSVIHFRQQLVLSREGLNAEAIRGIRQHAETNCEVDTLVELIRVQVTLHRPLCRTGSSP